MLLSPVWPPSRALATKCALGLLCSVFVSACATQERVQAPELLWPEPPATARIKFVGILSSQEELTRSASEPFVAALLGPKRRPDSLDQPMGVAVSRDGSRLFVADYAKPGVLLFDLKAKRMSPFGADGPGFKTPLGIAIDEQDTVYVVDSVPKLIRVFDRSGKLLRTITHESLERPTGIAVDSSRRRLYVADTASKQSDNHVIRVFDTSGEYLRAFGGAGSAEGKFLFPTYLALDSRGNLYVADTLNARIQAFDPEGRHLRTFGERGDAFGMFDAPKGVALDSFDNLYAVDSSWSNIQIFNQRAQVLLFFGGRGRDPGLLYNPTGIAIDRENRIYVADAFNGRIGIYQLINTTAQDSFPAAPPAKK